MFLITDVRIAVRLWLRRPMIPALVLSSLALGMGASVGVFTVLDRAIWRPLPLAEAERVVWIQSVDRGDADASSPGVFATWRDGSRMLSSCGAMRSLEGTWRDTAGADRLIGVQASAGVFTTLRMPVSAGRILTPDDERIGAAPVVVISDRLWRTRFGSDPAAVGRIIELDSRSRTIVGVLGPAANELPFGGDWWTPLPPVDGSRVSGARYLNVVGRLAAGSPEELEVELTSLMQAAGATGESGLPLRARAQQVSEAFVDASARLLVPLFIAVLVVLLIAASNAASLTIAEGQRRRQEFATRAALGASKSRLAGQLISESSILSLAAAGLGLLVAQWCVDALLLILPAELTRAGGARVDMRALAFAGGLALLVALIVALIPSWRLLRSDLATVFALDARGLASGQQRLRRVFVAAQIALATALGLAGAVMVETTRHLAAAPLGYDGADVLTAALRFPARDYPSDAALRSTIESIVTAAQQLPGVEAAAIATRAPFTGGAPGSNVALAAADATRETQARIRFVTPGFFKSIGVAVLEGRDVAATDGPLDEPVVLINETLARRLVNGRSPIGQSLVFDVADFNHADARRPWRIVGRIADVRDRGPRLEPEPEVFVPIQQGPVSVLDWIGRQALLAVRPAAGQTVSPIALRAAVQRVDSRLPLFDVRTLADRFDAHVSTERILTAILMPLAAMGFALAGCGIFALMMHLVTTRRREMAIRLVLGATPLGVIRAIVRDGAQLAAVGVSVGLLSAVWLEDAFGSLVFGVDSLSPSVVLPACLTVMVTTLIAAWWPARRATMQDPTAVLRSE